MKPLLILSFSLAAWSVAVNVVMSIAEIEPLPPVRWRMVKSVPDVIVEESMRAGINPQLVMALAWRESNWEPSLVSPTDDWGVMQLHRSTWQALKVSHPLDVRQNIIAGVGLLAAYLKTCENEHAALEAYAHGGCR